jgi:hypothetical protein
MYIQYALLAWAVIATLVAAVAILAANRRLPFPLPDLGGAILPCGDKRTYDAVVSVLKNVSNKKVFLEVNTKAVRRTIFTDGTIVNCTDPDVYAKMGQPRWAIALQPTDQPWEQMNRVASILAGRSVKFENLGQFDAEVPSEAMVGLTFANGLLGNSTFICRLNGREMPRPDTGNT